MRRIGDNLKKQTNQRNWARLFLVLFLTAIEAAARDKNIAPKKERAPRHIVVSIPHRKLALMEDGQVLKVYPVAVGANVSPSPRGQMKVVSRLSNPTYYHPGKVVPPGKNNPLGTRWMGLSEKGYGIHGTNDPRSIGKAASHGCVRMAKRDLEELFEMVQVGDTVEIRGESDEQTAQIFGETQSAGAEAAVVGEQ